MKCDVWSPKVEEKHLSKFKHFKVGLGLGFEVCINKEINFTFEGTNMRSYFKLMCICY